MHPPRSLSLAAVAAAALIALPGSALASSKTVLEGDSGTTRAKAEIDLELPVPHPTVTVHYETADGTATAGRDYLPRSGSVTFGPLDTEREVSVTVLGDTLYEGDETFFLETSSFGGGDHEGEGKTITITDDDPAPTVSVGDVTVSENGGAARFDASLSAPSGRPTTVAFATADGTALAGSDYAATSGTLTFAPGETTKPVSVSVLDDRAHEDTEAFSLSLSNPAGATLGAATVGHATVIDDDAATAATTASPLVVSAPQPATLAAPSAPRVQTPVRPALLRTSFEGLTAGHALLLELSCATGAPCEGTLRLTNGSLIVGQATYALAGGTSGELSVRLSRAARRALEHRGRLALTATPAAGLAKRFTVRLARVH